MDNPSLYLVFTSTKTGRKGKRSSWASDAAHLWRGSAGGQDEAAHGINCTGKCSQFG